MTGLQVTPRLLRQLRCNALYGESLVLVDRSAACARPPRGTCKEAVRARGAAALLEQRRYHQTRSIFNQTPTEVGWGLYNKLAPGAARSGVAAAVGGGSTSASSAVRRREDGPPLNAPKGPRALMRPTRRRGRIAETSEQARREAKYDPGHQKLLELHRALEKGHQPPRAGEVARAYVQYAKFKTSRLSLEPEQAELLLEALAWLKSWVVEERRHLVQVEIEGRRSLGDKNIDDAEMRQKLLHDFNCDGDGAISWELEFRFSRQDVAAPLYAVQQVWSDAATPNRAVYSRLATAVYEELQRMQQEKEQKLLRQPVARQESRTVQWLTLLSEKGAASKRRAQGILDVPETAQKEGERFSKEMKDDMLAYIRALARHGQVLLAQDLLFQHYNQLAEVPTVVWRQLIKGMVQESRGSELDKLIAQMRSRGVAFDSLLHEKIIDYYARSKHDMEGIKQWFEYADLQPTAHAINSALRLCIEKEDFKWGDKMLKTVLENPPDRRDFWNNVLVFAAAKGHGVEEIERMMDVAAHWTRHAKLGSPSIGSINALVEWANARDNPYLAERFIALGKKFGLVESVDTYQLQLAYRIKSNDVTGAMAAYGELQRRNAEIDPSQINGLIRCHCSRDIDGEQVQVLADELHSRNASLEPETIAALTGWHARREEWEDLHDLMETYAFRVGQHGRQLIQTQLTDYLLSPATTDTNAWPAYQFLKTFFEETSVETRVTIMESFFDKQRPDMAVHVFGGIRGTQETSLKPSAEVYSKCLTGIAKFSDQECLTTVHNLFNLDGNIDPSTKTNNAFMHAYTSCNDSFRALRFWDDIVTSREGPTYSSILLAFRACEQDQRGGHIATSIWRRLKKDDVEITKELYAGYIGALSGDNKYEDCIELCRNAHKESLEVDALMLGAFYNALRNPERREQMKQWASKAYPKAYDDLLGLGMTRVLYRQDDSVDPIVEEVLGLPEKSFFNIGPDGHVPADP